MRNRAVITTKDAWDENGIGIYLHWDGSPNQVYAYLRYCKLKGVSSPGMDESYAMARLTQVIANDIGGTLNIGIGRIRDLDYDNGDNGTYIIGDGWEVIKRLFCHQPDDIIEDDIIEQMIRMNERQPERERLETERLL